MTIPSLILSNVCSIANKMDEAELLMSRTRPDIAVFVESWLNGETPDSAVSISGYTVLRCDRDSLGGGLLCYVSSDYSANMIDLIPLSALTACKTEMLTIYIKDLNLIVIAIYHYASRE